MDAPIASSSAELLKTDVPKAFSQGA